MADITLISGSTLGGAEYVAEHLAEKLEEAGFTTETLHGPLLEDLSASGRCRLASAGADHDESGDVSVRWHDS